MNKKTVDKTAKFWNKMANRYAKSTISDEEAYQRKMDETRRYLRPDMKVLEMACGTGTTAIAHAPHVKHIVCMDISSEMLNIAQGKAESAGVDNLSFECADLDSFAAEEASFDVVMAHSILHLLPDPKAAMDKAFQLLKPGGLFVSNSVCMGDGSFIWKLVVPLAGAVNLAPFVNIFTREQLDANFAQAGFEIEHQWKPYKKMTAFVIAKKPED